MSGKRDRVEIIADILDLCSKPKTKTQVMYGTNLSWKMLQNYLSELQSREFLENQSTSKKYVATKRGLEFIKKWRALQELL